VIEVSSQALFQGAKRPSSRVEDFCGEKIESRTGLMRRQPVQYSLHQTRLPIAKTQRDLDQLYDESTFVIAGNLGSRQ
jgi:hypothetical protein